MNTYADIINFKRPPSNHNHLSIESRASQFSPFAALTGYDDEIKETSRTTTKKITINDELKEMLNAKLNYINEHINENYNISITYFIKDTKKEGGKYITKEGIIKRIDTVNEIIKFTDNTNITMNNIINITGDIFNSLYDN